MNFFRKTPCAPCASDPEISGNSDFPFVRLGRGKGKPDASGLVGNLINDPFPLAGESADADDEEEDDDDDDDDDEDDDEEDDDDDDTDEL